MERGMLFGKTGPVVWAFFMFTVLSYPVFAGITVEPNGVIPYGTTLTVRMDGLNGVRTVELEMVKDENGNGKADSGEPRLMEKTRVTDGVRTGKLRDYCAADNVIEFHFRVTSLIEPGKYVVRYTPGPGRLAKGAAIEIVERSGGFLSWFKGYVADISEVIDDPAPVLGMVRDIAARGRIKKTDIWLMNGDTFEIESRLTNTGDCMNPCWSPDGKQVACIRWINDGGQLWVLTVGKEGVVSNPERMAADIPGSLLNPVWSHNGKEIALLSGNDLWLVNADGSGAKKAVSMDNMEKILAWSRDDGHVIFAAAPAKDTPAPVQGGGLPGLDDSEIKPEDRGIWDIWQVDIRTGKRERLVYDLFWQWVGYISPDGSKVVFPVKETAGGYELWLREGKNFKDARRLTEGRDMDVEPSWSSDGKWIVFVSDRDQ